MKINFYHKLDLTKSTVIEINHPKPKKRTKQDDNYDLTEKRMILEKILPMLSERAREIIQCKFIEGLSQKETGERIGLSQMHVSRLQRTAIKKQQVAANQQNTC